MKVDQTAGRVGAWQISNFSSPGCMLVVEWRLHALRAQQASVSHKVRMYEQHLLAGTPVLKYFDAPQVESGYSDYSKSRGYVAGRYVVEE